ncbi:MAG: hypothetical protein HFH37_07910 [Lachnospiraceae bacterium]|nr:hypothetical protein [Lachnospiraceae bacterium]
MQELAQTETSGKVSTNRTNSRNRELREEHKGVPFLPEWIDGYLEYMNTQEFQVTDKLKVQPNLTRGKYLLSIGWEES